MSEIIKSFYYDSARKLNFDRILHLDSLKLDLNKKNVLETGCGGVGDITSFLVRKGANLTLNDARIDNIMENMKNNNLNLTYNTWDLNEDINTDEKYDIIICYGTLYHLTEPENAIKTFSKLCKEYTIISTVTSGKNNEDINILFETNTPEQGFKGYGCRPGRLFVWNKLKENFKFVYTVKTQPDNEDYPLQFPSNHSSSRNIFIGSHIKLENELFSEDLLNEYAIH